MRTLSLNWEGARQGLITSGLNHVANHIAIKIAVPSPKEIYDAYPTENPYGQDFCSTSRNECAIRMSETFDDLGIDISESTKFRKTRKHNGVVHQPSAKAFADWLEGYTELRNPARLEKTDGTDYTLSDFKNKSGIIYFVHPEYGGTGPGHIDVIYNGQIGSGFYDNAKIWF